MVCDTCDAVMPIYFPELAWQRELRELRKCGN
jgi:hypothetical protein